MKDGHMMEDNEEEEEISEDDTSTQTCCGCFKVPDTEETAKGEETEMIEIPPDFNREVTEELETIRQSENEAENIVSDLIDIVITDIIT